MTSDDAMHCFLGSMYTLGRSLTSIWTDHPYFEDQLNGTETDTRHLTDLTIFYDKTIFLIVKKYSGKISSKSKVKKMLLR